jgi:hypothetical protein
MPIQSKSAEPLRIAETPEFKELQAQIEEATSLLASISNRIVAIEAKMRPNTANMPSIPRAHVDREPDFQESIAEMRKIAGIK